MATILVDEDLCTRCGLCTVVCPMSIVDPADENTLPVVRDEKADMCIGCGHCEVICPTQALLLNILPDGKEECPAGAGELDARDLGYYMKKRRSVRHFTEEPVSKEDILQVLDIVRYAPSGSNGQPVEWTVLHNPEDVRTVAALTIEWLKTLINIAHPLNVYAPVLIRAWENGHDVICRDAPHLLVAHVPENTPIASVDGIIAVTHFDIAAPAFGIGTCWAGFIEMAALSCEPLKKELGIPAGRTCAFAMLFGHPKYTTYGLPRRNPVKVTWR
ncbi:nitroreductase family protein [Methanogenium sp. S4BF]|uniref:nitroreductase family protein n=1 Tax=Methanogenium sp. S4BF TaxID=1789226 RepID=UPI002417678F|nr:nitroreductase family protein [Methanogenium sp. S4BF]WFN33852.1 nitroreductase family protein [Methanogenium sp. S4BF]